MLAPATPFDNGLIARLRCETQGDYRNPSGILRDDLRHAFGIVSGKPPVTMPERILKPDTLLAADRVRGF